MRLRDKNAEPGYEVFLSQITATRVPRRYECHLHRDSRCTQETVSFLSDLLHTERQRHGTRAGTRLLSCAKQAVLVLRWLFDGTRVTQLTRDNAISRTTGYDYLHEGIAVLAAQAPSLHGALLAAKAAGYAYAMLDGTLIENDRVSTPDPAPGVACGGGRRNTPTTAGTPRSLPPPTAGLPGPARPGTRHH